MGGMVGVCGGFEGIQVVMRGWETTGHCKDGGHPREFWGWGGDTGLESQGRALGGRGQVLGLGGQAGTVGLERWWGGGG